MLAEVGSTAAVQTERRRLNRGNAEVVVWFNTIILIIIRIMSDCAINGQGMMNER